MHDALHDAPRHLSFAGRVSRWPAVKVCDGPSAGRPPTLPHQSFTPVRNASAKIRRPRESSTWSTTIDKIRKIAVQQMKKLDKFSKIRPYLPVSTNIRQLVDQYQTISDALQFCRYGSILVEFLYQVSYTTVHPLVISTILDDMVQYQYNPPLNLTRPHSTPPPLLTPPPLDLTRPHYVSIEVRNPPCGSFCFLSFIKYRCLVYNWKKNVVSCYRIENKTYILFIQSAYIQAIS